MKRLVFLLLLAGCKPEPPSETSVRIAGRWYLATNVSVSDNNTLRCNIQYDGSEFISPPPWVVRKRYLQVLSDLDVGFKADADAKAGDIFDRISKEQSNSPPWEDYQVVPLRR